MSANEFLGMLVGALITLGSFIGVIKKFWLDPRRETEEKMEKIRLEQIKSQNDNTQAINTLIGEIKVLTLQFSNQQGVIEEIKDEQNDHSKRIGKLENKVAVLSNIEKIN